MNEYHTTKAKRYKRPRTFMKKKGRKKMLIRNFILLMPFFPNIYKTLSIE